MMEIDAGYASLSQLIEIFGKLKLSSANEAETRKKVIDGVIEQVLGWEAIHDIGYEVRVSEDGKTTFADYLLSTATTSILIEAKKADKTFGLPINKTSAMLGGVLSEGEVGKAIKQVRDYARKLSVPYAVATNGDAWIIFPAIRTDRVPFEKTRAVIFRDLEDIKSRFVEFWELLSRQRVIEGNLESALFGEEKIVARRRLISILKEPGYRLGRNRVYEHIESAVATALTDEALLENRDALEACYVKSSERVKYDSRLKMHISDIKPQLERKVVRPRKRKDFRHLDVTIEKTSEKRPQFLLLLGPVGAGKTTFLYYTRKVSAAEAIDNKVVWLYVDFKRATENDNPRQFIYHELLRLLENDEDFELGSWENTIRHAYDDLISKLRNGSLYLLYKTDKDEFNKTIAEKINAEREQVEPYVEKLLHYTSRKYPIFLVIDNVDQLESEQYQRTVFMEAQAAARKMNSSVIMSLRDVTYLKHRNKPVFDAFQVDTIYIDPPAVLPVLSRRFAYAKRCIEGKSTEIVSESGIRFHVKDLGIFFEIVSTSLLKEDTGYLIDVMSGGDIRRALTFVRSFLASGHASADKALHTYLTEGKYRFPPHEVFKGAVFGQKKYYREEESIILNIYDSKLGTPGLQLLRLQVLSRLVKSASEATYEGTTLESMQSDLYRVGVPPADVFTVVDALLGNSAIRTSDGLPLSSETKLLPTRLGGFCVQELATRFEYFEPCILDANIYNDEIWEQMVDLTNKVDSASSVQQKMETRIKRATLFGEYLNNLEQQWIVKCNRYKLNADWGDNLIKELTNRLNKEFDSVAVSAAKNYPIP
ncbi:MAG: AAA family ATPase [Pseudomonadota bacterium]